MKILWSILLGLTLISCGEKNDDAGSSESIGIQANGLASVENVKFEIERKLANIEKLNKDNMRDFESDLNLYIVTATLQFPSLMGEKIQCKKSPNRLNKVESYSQDFDQGAHRAKLTIEIGRDDLYSVQLNCHIINKNHQIIYSHPEREVYQDLIIDEQVSFNELSLISNQEIKLGVLLLKDRAELDLADSQVKLRAETFISENAKIYSFPNSVSALQGEKGKNGGVLSIHIYRADGEVTIELNGENGGSYIPNFKDGTRAKAGKAADIIGRGGRGRAYRKCRDIRLAANAGSGANGLHGANGFDGGDSGHFQISLTKESHIKIHNLSKAGVGSKGQEGQAGGARGGFKSSVKRTSLDGYSDVAKKMHASRCRVNTDYRASPGREGKKGRNGRAGLTGKDKMSILRNGERIEIFQ